MSAPRRYALVAVALAGIAVSLFAFHRETGLSVTLQRAVLLASALVSAVAMATYQVTTDSGAERLPVESGVAAGAFWTVFWVLFVLSMGVLGTGSSSAGALFDGLLGTVAVGGFTLLVGVGIAARVAAGDPPGRRTLDAYREGKREGSDER